MQYVGIHLKRSANWRVKESYNVVTFQQVEPTDTVSELQWFLAIISNMGIIRLPELEGYWKTLWVAEIPFFSQVMPCDRFELLFWMLHVSRSTGPLKRIDRVCLFVEKILSRF